MSKRVYLATEVHDVLVQALEGMGYTLVQRSDNPVQEAMTCEGLIISNNLKVDKALIDAAPQLKWIARLGSGMEIVDTAYAASRGIACISSPEGNSNAVAEHALGLLLSLTKNIDRSAQEVRSGQWLREANRGIELEGRTMGIIGFGHTGSAFAKS